MALLWKSPMQRGVSSLRGNYSGADDSSDWSGLDINRQCVFLESPATGYKAVKFIVQYGDIDPRYSDVRSLCERSADVKMYEGSETWTRWLIKYPSDWIGYFPKHDELHSWPGIGSSGGSAMEWHQAPTNEDWSTLPLGSAPIYTGASDQYLTMELVNQQTSTAYKTWNLVPLVREHWYEWLLHGKWSTNANVGFVEVWIDGVNVIPKFMAATLYPNCYNYLTWGVYRNHFIGDQSLVWDFNAAGGVNYKGFPPVNGGKVFPNIEVQSLQIAGAVHGDTRADVMNAYQLTGVGPEPPPVVPPPSVSQVGTRAVLGASALSKLQTLSRIQSQDEVLNRLQDHQMQVLNPVLRALGTNPTVTGAKAGNDALAKLIAALQQIGLIKDGTS